MENNTEKKTRRNFFVLKGFQLRFGVVIFTTAFFVSTLSIWTAYITTWNEVSRRIQGVRFYERIYNVFEREPDRQKGAEMVNSIFTVEFAEIFDRISTLLMVRLLFGSVLFFLLSVFISHKVAGPAVRMRNAANAIMDGDLSVDLTSLRAGDELTELARAINAAIIKLRLLMERYREMANKLTELTAKISVYTEGGQVASSESTHLIKELEVVSNQLITEMNYFKTKKPAEGKTPPQESAQEGIRHF